MNDQQRTKQMQAIHIQYAQMVRDGVLPADRDCHVWASEILGRVISTLKACTDSELNSLRDRLNAKSGKLLARCTAEFERCGIKNPDAWIAALSKYPKFHRWAGFTLQTMPEKQLYHCLMILERRNAKSSQPQYARRAQPAQIKSKQKTLFGS